MALKHYSELVNATAQEVRLYSEDGLDSRGMFVADEQRHIYAAIAIFDEEDEALPDVHADIIVLARVEGDYIIIEEDRTDRPLVDALTQNAGVPESQIICAYAGEKVPEQVASA